MCNKSFIRKHVLHSHLKRHKGEKSILCSSCGQLFCTGAELNIHIRRHHTLEKPYKCSYCPKVSFTEPYLIISNDNFYLEDIYIKSFKTGV